MAAEPPAGADRVHGLADTGALYALLSRRDRWHAACAEAFRELHLPFATTAAVLTELFHLAGPRRDAVEAVWRLVHSPALEVVPLQPSDLPRMEELMETYRDRPMDFADASLVTLAEREALTTVFTVDHDDFETYRIGGRRHFRIVPGRMT